MKNPGYDNSGQNDQIGIREYLVLFVILVLGLTVRTAALLMFDHNPESDEITYRAIALNILSGNGVLDDMGNRAMYNAGYPLFVLAPIFYFFGKNLLAARLANLILGLVSIVLCYFVAREAGAGRIGRLLAAAFWALYLPACLYVVYLFKENLMIPLMLGIMWCALRLSRKEDFKTAVLCGILFGLIAMVGNAAFALTGAVALALLILQASFSQRVKLLSVMLIAAVIVAMPWVIRNYLVVGAPILNTNGGFNLYLGNNPVANGWFVSIADTPRGPTWESLRKRGEVAASEVLKQEAIAWIKANPAAFAFLAIKKAVYFWTPPVHKLDVATGMERIVRMSWLVQYVLIVAVAFLSLFLKSLRTNRQIIILWVGVLGYTAIHMLFYVIFRYRLPIMPIVAVISAMTIEAYVISYLKRSVLYESVL